MANRTRMSPRISTNKLAEYMRATPSRRRKIIEQQKNPPTYMVTWYADAQSAITKFILGGCADESILKNEINRLNGLTTQNETEETRNKTNVDALAAFLNWYEQLDLKGYELTAGPNSQPKLVCSGVEVSVRPEVFIRGTETRNGEFVGCIKLYFSKDSKLDDESGSYVGALLHQYSCRHLASGRKVKQKACITIDVFGQQAFVAPKAIVKRSADIDAACKEIEVIWPTLN